MGITYELTPHGVVDRYTSHEGIVHNNINELGYDWEQVGDPAIEPRYPSKVYLPQTTEDIVAAVKEVNALGQKLTVRGSGHSSNDLVVVEGGVLMSTSRLNKILAVDEEAMTAKVQAGAISAEIDASLLAGGYGLPVLGDHNDITVGGFSSVGGISPVSHRLGLFIDNVQEIEYVTPDGELRACSKSNNRSELFKVLGGTGQHGIIATLTCNIIRIDKYGTILRNKASLYRNLDRFLEASGRFLNDPGDAMMGRGGWIDMPAPGMQIRVGMLSVYVQTSQSWYKSLRDKFGYGYLHRIGHWAGITPRPIELLLKGLGFLGLVFSPKYGSIKNVECFTDRITTSTVGDPTRWFVLICPTDKYEVVAKKLYELALDCRHEHSCFTFVCLYIKGIRSEYLAKGDPNKLFCELTLYLGINLKAMNRQILVDLVSAIDDLCVEYGSYRYIHTITVKDPDRRRRIDPNASYAETVRTASS